VERIHRHLSHLLCRFFWRSRAETPQGSLPAFASGHVASTTGATRIRPMTGQHALFPLYPHCYCLALRPPSLACARGGTGLPRSPRLTRMGEVLSMRREPGVYSCHTKQLT
jgi:hypothetical protein